MKLTNLIDIDPGEPTTFNDIVMLANPHRTALDQPGLVSCPKVSCRRGIQVWTPVATGYTTSTHEPSSSDCPD